MQLIPRIGEGAPSVDLELELELYLMLATYRTITVGYGCDEIDHALKPARALYESSGDRVQKSLAMVFISLLHFARAELRQGLEAAEPLTRYGQGIKHEPALLYGLMMESWALLNLGRLDESLDRCQQSRALLTPELAGRLKRFQACPAKSPLFWASCRR